MSKKRYTITPRERQANKQLLTAFQGWMAANGYSSNTAKIYRGCLGRALRAAQNAGDDTAVPDSYYGSISTETERKVRLAWNLFLRFRATTGASQFVGQQNAAVIIRAWAESEGIFDDSVEKAVQSMRHHTAKTLTGGFLEVLEEAGALELEEAIVCQEALAWAQLEWGFNQEPTARELPTPDEMRTLLYHLSDEERIACLIILLTGWSIEDLAMLRWRDFKNAAIHPYSPKLKPFILPTGARNILSAWKAQIGPTKPTNLILSMRVKTLRRLLCDQNMAEWSTDAGITPPVTVQDLQAFATRR